MAEMVHRRPSAKFFEGQTPPALPIMSADNIDWYKEQVDRCKNGYSFRGDRFTGDQWWYYNLCPMVVAKLDKNGNPTNEFDTAYPYWSQQDDYLFKQIEEAEQDRKGVFLFTGRGYGKTYLVISIGGKLFFLKKGSHGVISASGDHHANETWKKFQALVLGVGKAHPTLRLSLSKEGTSGDEIVAGKRVMVDGEWIFEQRSLMEKIVYANQAGKTKGRRLDFQHWEEVGDWAGAAKLKECIAASEGTYWVGDIKKCRDFYTGTGGTVLSDQAKEVCYNPDSFGLYKVKDWSERGTGIVIPAFKKYGGTWEKTGFSDEEKAKEILNQKRADKKKDPDPTAYNKFIQEYPFNIEEMFQRKGGNRFNLEAIGNTITMYEMFPEKKQGEYGNLQWEKNQYGEKTGKVTWVPDPNGKMWILEKPVINPETGNAWERLYVGGYDGIDMGTEDNNSGQGSSGALSIKKRLLPGSGLANTYVFHYRDRPTDIDEFFEGTLMACVYFNLHKALNIEFSKIAIRGYFKKKNAMHYFMPRPRITLDNASKSEESSLIGTTATDKNFQQGESFLATYTKDMGDQILNYEVCIDLRDFTMDNRGKHDLTVSMFMAEIGEDEFSDKPVLKPKPKPLPYKIGYYTDSNGIKRWGKIPEKNQNPFGFKPDAPIMAHLNSVLKPGYG